MKMIKEPKVCMVTVPLQQLSGGYHTMITNLLQTFEPITHEVIFITFNYPLNMDLKPNIKPIFLKYRNSDFILTKIVSFFLVQLQVSFTLIRFNSQIGEKIFFLTGTSLLPMLTAKLLGKRTILTAIASESKNIMHIYKGKFLFGTILSNIVLALEILCRDISDGIIVESPNLILTLGLDKYKHKMFPKGALFIDTNLFRTTTPLCNRKNLIGYFGRLSEEKGVINFAKSARQILNKCDNVEFLIGGDGPLYNNIEKETVNCKTTLCGQIPHENLYNYLNKVKLLVLPSYTEGLPNIVLEAMACGTPVLATSVGAIPDIIKDSETGFIMENNSPTCIAENVIRALEFPDLDKIASNARKLVESEYTYEVTVERYKTILENC